MRMIDGEALRRAFGRPCDWASKSCTPSCMRESRCEGGYAECPHCGAKILRCEALNGVCDECSQESID